MKFTRFLGWAALCLVTTAPLQSHASEYGCKVLLCLASPQGPKQFVECHSPINQLYSDLRHGKPFPTCDQADGNSPGNFARPAQEPFDPCPAGLTPAATGMLVAQEYHKSGVMGFPTNAGVSEARNGESGQGERACVGKLVNTYLTGSLDDTRTINVFDQVVWQPFKGYSAFDIYIDNKLFNRVWY